MNSSPAPAQAVQSLLDQLLHDPQACGRLRSFAARRIALSGASECLPDYDADDAVQECYLRVCRQLANANSGWRPKPRHIADATAFEGWLRAIINALIANEVMAARTRRQRESQCHPAAAADVIAQVQARCRRHRLLAQLREHYQHNQAWLRRIDQWANDPAGRYHGKPYHVFALREKVTALLAEDPPGLG